MKTKDKGIDSIENMSLEDFESSTINSAFSTIGNGSLEKGRNIVLQLATRLTYARIAHPSFCYRGSAYKVIESEWNEFTLEMARGDFPRSEDEAMDVITTLVRFMNCE